MNTKKADVATTAAIYAAKKKLEKDLEENKCQIEMRNKKAEADAQAAIYAAAREIETRKKKAEGESSAEIYATGLDVDVKNKKAESQCMASIRAAELESDARIKKTSADMAAQIHAATIDVELRNRRLDAEVAAAVYAAKKKLEQRLEEEKLAKESYRVRAAEFTAEHELEMHKLKQEADRRRLTLTAQLDRDAIQARQEMAALRERLDVEKGMSAASLQRLSLESTRDIYQKLPLNSVRMVNVTNGGGSLDSMLPALIGFGAAQQQVVATTKE